MAENGGGNVQPKAAEEQAQRQMVVRVDERELKTSYANFFRANGNPDDMFVDFGLSMMAQTQAPQGQPEMIFQAGQRVIMNYYTAKRLALALGQLIRQHEQQFGELELDMAKRTKRQS